LVIRTTPFHERVSAANQTGLWSHWAGYLVAEKYQMAEKFEYFAVRNSAGIFDTSPLYKYRIYGRDAEAYLAGVLARDIRTCRPGRAQYTLWCDDRGFILEDGVVFRHSDDEFHLTTARPNLAYFGDLIGRHQVVIEDVSDHYAALAVQGPKSREVLAALAPEIGDLRFFHLTDAKVADVPVTVSRTGYTGDLGYELWIPAHDAIRVWDTVIEAGADRGVIPFGQIALLMTRIEAGLLLIDVDFESSRFAWNDHHRSTPIELGLGWMFRNLEAQDRPFIGRDAIRRELADGTPRWSMVGLVVDWAEYDRRYREAGLIAPKDHVPAPYEMMVYGKKRKRVGYATGFMYSPILQRHIAMARVRSDLATSGTRVNVEVTINHKYQMVAAHVARMPLYNPARKTA
jgi:aminomethyltransferase